MNFVSQISYHRKKRKDSIIKLSRNCRLFVNCSRASTYKPHSRKKSLIFSYTHPHSQPVSLIKFTRERSAFRLLDVCLSVVCMILQSYCDTSYLKSVMNQMWILKKSKDMLEYMLSRSLSSHSSFVHSKLKTKIKRTS